MALAGAVSLEAQCTCTGQTQTVNWLGWSLNFRRPCLTQATTSGGRGGGLEVSNVRFNGRLVLFKGHLPILNVKYQNDACGPYRDWQYEENTFQCAGQVFAAGRCEGPAITNCNNPAGGDVGNFCGVSVDRNAERLLLTTLLRAGWYRYQLEWYFFAGGTFRPAIKWTGVPHSCLNNTHLHMAYWRLDFDIEDGPNTVFEGSTVPLVHDYWEEWDPLFTEMTRAKDPSGSRRWLIRNSVTNRGYQVLMPEAVSTTGEGDGAAVAPQISDIWALLYRAANQEETDDCAGLSGCGYWSHLSRFVTPSSDANHMIDKDVVLWYSAAHLHQGSPSPPACTAVNGPIVKPDPKGPAW